MLHTNSNVLKNTVRQYILAQINFDNYDYVVPSTPEGRVQLCYMIFKSEKKYALNRYPYTNERLIFRDWLQGLAPACSLPFLWAGSAVNLVAKWRECTAYEVSRISEYDAAYYCLDLCVREFYGMLDDARAGKPIIKTVKNK